MLLLLQPRITLAILSIINKFFYKCMSVFWQLTIRKRILSLTTSSALPAVSGAAIHIHGCALCHSIHLHINCDQASQTHTLTDFPFSSIRWHQEPFFMDPKSSCNSIFSLLGFPVLEINHLWSQGCSFCLN